MSVNYRLSLQMNCHTLTCHDLSDSSGRQKKSDLIADRSSPPQQSLTFTNLPSTMHSQKQNHQ
ncbi:hypothetical protein PtA15_1A370 [Puccinia triticina]|uniref:Uncharacterized protein n=1 Tax=Puccinia triticina TaxID=208348 RepID=A0ABY7CAT3_9BASI|nr:uncharacterized protein PtA15_1A370 [Puccinia triticina]WAQ81032.1 hypothetical protein PtA15_1A370 [Puccinia triticina]WAR51921.1 hypothetical protein PtB15_1B358 [Puccinia triticina]